MNKYLVIIGATMITLHSSTVIGLPVDRTCTVCREGAELRRNGLTPYSQRGRMRRSTLQRLTNGSYSRRQSAHAMRSLLGSPYAIDSANSIHYYPMENDSSTYVGFRYTKRNRWDGQIYIRVNQVVPYRR